MASPIKRGLAGSQVSDLSPLNDEFTPLNQTSFIAPYGMRLRQTITSSGSVTIPTGIEWVYAIVVGAGGGGIAWGWTIPVSTCIVGAGAATSEGGYSRYGHIIAGGGGRGSSIPVLGGAGGSVRPGGTNYWGIPGGAGGSTTSTANGIVGAPGSGAGGGQSTSFAGGTGGNGSNGISGGGGGASSGTGSSTQTGGNGGNGLVGGGGGGVVNTTGTRTGGNGGNGIGIDGTIYTGGTGSTGTNTNGAGGGGAGIAGNGSNASGQTGGAGGLGGGGGGGATTGIAGGAGGAGILYLYY
jgi:hypothetical protein